MNSLGSAAGATYILPWDGNFFLNSKAWANITSSISTIFNSNSINSTATNSPITAGEFLSSSSTQYFYVQMAHMKNGSVNDMLKSPSTPSAPRNHKPCIDPTMLPRDKGSRKRKSKTLSTHSVLSNKTTWIRFVRWISGKFDSSSSV